uniref:Doublecortin domain-containing protein n=1 Tax=Amphiprion ocellaris TaxID=80972 RepID=A0AAQ5Z2X1_AMPOC
MPRTAGRGDLPPTKTIIVYRNGDAFFPGRKLVVNPRQLSTFDSFLTFLTRAIEAPFGAVRRLYTPRQGHRVQHMDDLKHGSVYVAIQPVVHSKFVVPARWERIADESYTIHVFTNGDILATPVRIRVPKYTRKSWESVLAMVTEKVRLRTGAVFRLCTLDGRPVCGPSELENNQHYVAVGTEKFKALPYDQCVPCRELLKKNNVIEGYEPCNVLSINYVVLIKLGETEALGNKTARPKSMSFHVGSVFNAQNKRSEMAGAAEVQEDRQLKVDLPIDQVKDNPILHCSLMRSLTYNRSSSTSPCKASLHDSDNLCLHRSSADSRKDVSTLIISFM